MDILTISHLACGTVAVIAGAVALATRKGLRVHIMAGRTFVVTMSLCSILGAVMGLVYIDRSYITFHAGVLATCLVLSGWLAAHARSGKPEGLAILLAWLNGANFLALVGVGLYALYFGNPFLGYVGEAYLFMAGMAGVALVGDLSLVWRRMVSGPHRIARHLWRMCLGFFIAAGSAFTGPGTKVFPKALQESGLLYLPELTILALMLFWLARTLWPRRKLKARKVND